MVRGPQLSNHTCYIWDWAAAEGAFERAVKLNPSLAIAHQWRAEFLADMQHIDEALASIARAPELDPLSLAIDASRAHVYWLARRGEELVAAASRILEMEPRYLLAHILYACGLDLLGLYDEGLEALAC